MMTGKEYKESLRKRNIVVYLQGKQIPAKELPDHPFIRGHVNSASVTYDLAFDPAYENLMTATSHLTGKNQPVHPHPSERGRPGQKSRCCACCHLKLTCYQRCVGFDAMNATYGTTYEMDQKYGTHYHERFKKFLEYIQDTDFMVAGAMTDPKGDRSKRPSQQSDPDLFVHVVEKNDKGIVICGAKAHMTGMVNSHEMLIMPTMSLKTGR